jgi:hypothetical protein
MEKLAMHYRIAAAGRALMPQLHFHLVEGGAGVSARAMGERDWVCQVNREDYVENLVGPAYLSRGQDYLRPGKFVFLIRLLPFGFQPFFVLVLRLRLGNLAARGTEPVC